MFTSGEYRWKLTLLFRAMGRSQVAVALEIKKTGSFGKQTIQTIKKNFKKLKGRNVVCAYVAIEERKSYVHRVTKENIGGFRCFTLAWHKVTGGILEDTQGTVPGGVGISEATAGAVICFTTDGSTPTEVANACSGGTTQTYSIPITVSSTKTVKAIGTLSGSTDSIVGSSAYTVIPYQIAPANPAVFMQ